MNIKILENQSAKNFVNTDNDFRSILDGSALKLINELKIIEEMTVFCTDDIVKNLFIKAEFKFCKMDPFYKSFPIYRHP